MDATAVVLLLIELVLVGLLAILSASEAAIHTVRRPEALEELIARGGRAGTISRRRATYLASIQVGEFLIVFTYAGIAAAFIAPRLSALVSVLVGLFIPRAIAARHPQGALFLLAWPLEILCLVMRPLVQVLFLLTQIATKPFGGIAQAGAMVTEEEIRALVETGQAQGVLEPTEREMISSIFELGEKDVREVMVPRTDIVALEVNTPSAEVLEEIQHNGHSRLPIYEGSLDQIVGMVYVKDLFQRLARGERNFDVRQFVRPVLFVPETKKADELLREMQRDKVHLAVVADEYGGTAGIVTLEDLVEEIVGEIRDEYDAEQSLVLPVSESEAVMDARIPFEEVRETFDIDVEPSEDYETLGGFITNHLGHFPRAGESIDVAGVRFTVESVEGKRIRRVRVTRLQRTPEPA